MKSLDKKIFYNKYFYLMVSLILSSFTHLFNPLGWPGLYYDEGIYMDRAMNLMYQLEIQEDPYFYDHPYFGQIFLAGILSVVGYPNIVNPQIGNSDSIELLYLIPRIIMGLLAVIDTFLVFQISIRLYNKNVALISSILFGLTPISWLLRWILLDSILLPFLLLSILLAIISKNYLNKNKNRMEIILILLSGISLGLAIFTKIPVFVTIPLIVFLVYKNNCRSFKKIGLWLIPVLFIPMIWPFYAIINGHFENWVKGLYYQTHRESQPFVNSLKSILFKDDPMFLILGIFGLIFAVIKRDYLILLWIIPFFLFFYLIGWVSFYHWIPLIPVFSIASGVLIVKLLERFANKGRITKILFSTFTIVFLIASISLVNTMAIITRNVNSVYFEAAANLYSYLSSIKNKTPFDKVTVIADPFYLWIAKYVFNLDNNYKSYFNVDSIGNRSILVVDKGFLNAMSRNDGSAKKINQIYYSDKSHRISTIWGKPKMAYNASIIDYNSQSIINPKGK